MRALAAGIHSHHLFKLGKAEAVLSDGTLRFEHLVKQAPKLPAWYDVDRAHGLHIHESPFGNDSFGDCVEAMTANKVLRSSAILEQRIAPITVGEVVAQNFLETDGNDVGLSIEDHLVRWRDRGVRMGGKVHRLHDFAAIRLRDRDALCRPLTLDLGVCAGLALPQSAMDQADAGKPWTVVKGHAGKKILGGHGTYIVAFNRTGPICITWGKRKQMTWEFYFTYYDEAFATFDLVHSRKVQRHIHLSALKPPDYALSL